MMRFRTNISLLPSFTPITHQHPLLLIGSCFTEHMASRFSHAGFQTLCNPFGILYNPVSMAECIHTVVEGRQIDTSMLFSHNGLWQSWQHHGTFTASTQEECLAMCQEQINKAHQQLQTPGVVFLTLGSNHCYVLNETGRVVANCHKMDQHLFSRKILSPSECVETLAPAVEALLAIGQRIILTVSPVRHWGYGAHGNQLSKSTLLLTVDELQQRSENKVEYFPAYEIMMDELRDYRFYDNDMLHPTPLAQDYIFEQLCHTYLDYHTNQLAQRYEKVYQMEQHRPLHPESEEYQLFEQQLQFLKKELGIK